MLSRHRFLAIVLGVVALLAIAAAASFFVPRYGDICRKDEITEAIECSSYHLVVVVIWHVGEWLNYYGVAITAIATGFIGYFTYTLWDVGGGQLHQLSAQINLAREEFIATHRPKLRVRRFLPHLVDEMPIKVSFVVVNVGESRAHIRRFEGHIGIQAIDGTAFNEAIVPKGLRMLEPGQADLFIAEVDLKYVDDWGITRNLQGGSFEFRGEIEYADDLGVIRRTAFWRIRDLGARMTKRPDPYNDWEYED